MNKGCSATVGHHRYRCTGRTEPLCSTTKFNRSATLPAGKQVIALTRTFPAADRRSTSDLTPRLGPSLYSLHVLPLSTSHRPPTPPPPSCESKLHTKLGHTTTDKGWSTDFRVWTSAEDSKFPRTLEQHSPLAQQHRTAAGSNKHSNEPSGSVNKKE